MYRFLTPIIAYYAYFVYCLTPTTEAIARAVAARNEPAPVAPFELPAPAPKREDHTDLDEDRQLRDEEEEAGYFDDAFARR
jgi:hypothetical protein